MDKKQLKALIKEMVRESLTEIFVEMKLENIVERVVKTQTRSVISESPSYEARKVQQQPAPRQNIKETIRSRMAVSDDEWKNIYENVDTEKLPPSGASTVVENPEFTTEDDLRKLGLL